MKLYRTNDTVNDTANDTVNDTANDTVNSKEQEVLDLSLIHISEPTRH